jgi:hypothetical protein
LVGQLSAGECRSVAGFSLYGFGCAAATTPSVNLLDGRGRPTLGKPHLVALLISWWLH